MNPSSSNCPTARTPQVARAPASSAVCVQALAASSMTWMAITRADIRRPAKVRTSACTAPPALAPPPLTSTAGAAAS
eukprot:10770645-Alexandrium_andersonii.AAC.1